MRRDSREWVHSYNRHRARLLQLLQPQTPVTTEGVRSISKSFRLVAPKRAADNFERAIISPQATAPQPCFKALKTIITLDYTRAACFRFT